MGGKKKGSFIKSNAIRDSKARRETYVIFEFEPSNGVPSLALKNSSPRCEYKSSH